MHHGYGGAVHDGDARLAEKVGELLGLTVHPQGTEHVPRAGNVDPETTTARGINAAELRVEQHRRTAPFQGMTA